MHTAHDTAIVVDPRGSFTIGMPEQLQLKVTNAGTAPTTGTTTVDDVLPAGLAFIAADGDGWACALAPGAGHVQCSTSDVFAGGRAFPPLTVTVRPSLDAWPAFVDTATVTAADDQFLPNNTASATVRLLGVGPPDLSPVLQLPTLSVGRSSVLVVTVHRTGATPSGTTTVTGAIPAGLRLVSATATGWTCTPGPQFACTTTSTTFARIRLSVIPSAAALPAVVFSAMVHNDGDRNAANDTATATLPVHGQLTFTRLQVGLRWQARHGHRRRSGIRRLAGLSLLGGLPSATVGVSCVAGCGRPKLLATASVRSPSRGVRLHFAHAIAVRARTRLVVFERAPGRATLKQRYAFEHTRHAGWHARVLRR